MEHMGRPIGRPVSLTCSANDIYATQVENIKNVPLSQSEIPTTFLGGVITYYETLVSNNLESSAS